MALDLHKREGERFKHTYTGTCIYMTRHPEVFIHVYWAYISR